MPAPRTTRREEKREPMIEIPAKELQVGDYIRAAGVTAIIHKLPIDRSQPFTAFWMRGNQATGEIDFDPDEAVTVFKRWPDGFPTAAEIKQTGKGL